MRARSHSLTIFSVEARSIVPHEIILPSVLADYQQQSATPGILMGIRRISIMRHKCVIMRFPHLLAINSDTARCIAEASYFLHLRRRPLRCGHQVGVAVAVGFYCISKCSHHKEAFYGCYSVADKKKYGLGQRRWMFALVLLLDWNVIISPARSIGYIVMHKCLPAFHQSGAQGSPIISSAYEAFLKYFHDGWLFGRRCLSWHWWHVSAAASARQSPPVAAYDVARHESAGFAVPPNGQYHQDIKPCSKHFSPGRALRQPRVKIDGLAWLRYAEASRMPPLLVNEPHVIIIDRDPCRQYHFLSWNNHVEISAASMPEERRQSRRLMAAWISSACMLSIGHAQWWLRPARQRKPPSTISRHALLLYDKFNERHRQHRSQPTI